MPHKIVCPNRHTNDFFLKDLKINYQKAQERKKINQIRCVACHDRGDSMIQSLAFAAKPLQGILSAQQTVTLRLTLATCLRASFPKTELIFFNLRFIIDC